MNKELDKLPDRWYCVVTKENQNILSKWRFSNNYDKLEIESITGICNKYNRKHHNPKNEIRGDIYDFGIEITFEQFKKWVLKEELKFEVGKWYKYTGKHIEGNFYARYSSKQSVSDRFYYDELITDGDYVKKHDWSCLDALPVLLTDLSEIQQYLPEGHVDKLPKQLTIDDLVEGEVYYCENTEFPRGGDGYIFLKKGDDLINHLSIGNLEFLMTRWDFWRDQYSVNLRLATPQERKWLIVCIKQNKFIPQDQLDKYDDEGNLMKKIMESKFKVGDWVYIHEYPGQWSSLCNKNCPDSAKYPIIAQIDDIKNNNDYYYGASIGNYGWDLSVLIKKNCIRLFTQQEIDSVLKPKSKFNVWYKCTFSGFSKCLSFIMDEHTEYGFDKFGSWYNKVNDCDVTYDRKNWELATEQEVKDRLLEYAKEKYPVGTMYNSAMDKSPGGVIKDLNFEVTMDKIYHKPRYIYHKGQWAEIVKSSKQDGKVESREIYPKSNEIVQSVNDGFIPRNIPKQEVHKRTNLKGLKSSNRFSPQSINKRSIY